MVKVESVPETVGSVQETVRYGKQLMTPDSGEVETFRQLYSTTLLDFDGRLAFEWAYVPAGLLEWDEPDLERALAAMELESLAALPSLSALPAAAAVMLTPADSRDEIGTKLANLLSAPLATWGDEVDPAVLAFAQFTVFSAVLPVEWSPLKKVPAPDAAFTAAAGAGVTGGIVKGAALGKGVALALGAKGTVLVLAGAGGVVVGTVALPLAAVGATAIAWALYRKRFTRPA